MKDDGGNKDDALYLDGVYEQAEQLKSQHSDQLVAKAQIHCPQFHRYVMEGYQSNSSFVMVLEKESKQNTPTLNLVAVMDDLTEQYRFHLLWA